MKILSYYILIGLGFMVYVELAYWYLKQKPGPKAKKATEAWEALKTSEKIFCLVIWPISIVVFFYAFLKGIFKKK